MTWSIRRTDRRMNGYNDFAYVASPNTYSFNDLILARNWCWETWGPSCELILFRKVKDLEFITDQWCWHTEFDNLKLYFKSSKEANWFKLKWL